METTKQDKPKKKPERPLPFRGIGDPIDSPTPTTLSGISMEACGSYDIPLIQHVYAEVRLFDDSLPVPSSSGGPGGSEQEAMLTPSMTGGVWRVRFTNLVPGPASDPFYRLKVRFMEAGNILNTLLTVRIRLDSSSGRPAVCS
ncbi:MAG TPA: hypothetical protein VKD72_00960 [Gemmataceae bacterium]|nr:hypothetical protein [Gemmataceae bacterium]